MLRHVTATRYATPLREGGSLPGVMEADDEGYYVVKFTAAGQGPKVLAAEVIAAGLGTALGLPIPELVTVEVDGVLGKTEPDQEIQQLLTDSAGRNLGMDFLPGSLDFDPDTADVDAGFAGRVLWFDALINNVDRSWRNPNMLSWHGRAYLIDHGSALTFHHQWSSASAAVTRPYPSAGDHVLIGEKPDVDSAHADLAPLVTRDLLRSVLADVPEAWLADDEPPGPVRDRYVTWLRDRLAAADSWLPGLRAAAAAGPRPRTPVESNRPSWLQPGYDGGPR